MLMYSKEANNRKQEIDRQHHTIPNQRANDKHHGNVYNLLTWYMAKFARESRYQEIEVEYYDFNWKKQRQKLSGWTVQIC